MVAVVTVDTVHSLKYAGNGFARVSQEKSDTELYNRLKLKSIHWDLKSLGLWLCRFKPGSGYQNVKAVTAM